MLTQWNESLWGDEGFSALAVQNNFLETIGIVMRDTAPPAFYVLGWLWGQAFGYSEVALRSLSLLLILGTAVFAGLLVYEISKSKINGLLVSLLIFGSPFLEPVAFEWRMYALLAFAVMGSVYFFITKKWLGYVIFTLLALYTHHFGLFTFVGEGVVFLLFDFKWREPKKWLSQLKPFLIVVALYTPWLYPFYLQLKRVQGSGFWLSKPKVTDLTELLYRFLTGGVKKEWQGIVALAALILLVTKEWRKVGLKWIALMIIFLSPMALAFGVSYLVTPIFYDRYLLATMAGTVTLVGVGTKKKFLIILVFMLVIFGVQSVNQFTHPTKRPFREMAEWVKREIKKEDKLINYNGAAHHLWESKYYGIPAPIYTPNGPLPLYVGTAQMKESDTTVTLPETKGRLGVITSEPIEKVALPDYKMIENKQFGSLNFSWWRKSK